MLRKLKKTVHDFHEEKKELHKERALLCDNNWLFDLAFQVDVTSHINDLNLKLQGNSKFIPSLVNDINAFNNEMQTNVRLPVGKFGFVPIQTHLKEQSECAADHGSLVKYADKSKLLQLSFESSHHAFGKEDDSILAFTKPFLLS